MNITPLTHYAEWDAEWTYCGKHVKTQDWNAGLVLAKPGERPTCEQCASQVQLDDQQFAEMAVWNDSLMKEGQ